jgi:hypothetical protein
VLLSVSGVKKIVVGKRLQTSKDFMNYEGAEAAVLLTVSKEGTIVIQVTEGFSRDEVMEVLEATLMMLGESEVELGEPLEETPKKYGTLH